MVLGGCEVNLLELTTLYTGLANMGEFGPYQLTKSCQQSAVSEEAVLKRDPLSRTAERFFLKKKPT